MLSDIVAQKDLTFTTEEINYLSINKDVWRFYQATSLHRTYVLRDLLPKHGLIVD